mmetsp:Transcript_96165/g.176125  ORF Transcript_96165/g.176125 Transcript_96165/m.176125 type:complete len:498 (+) Transcript_96165:97-1590(+)
MNKIVLFLGSLVCCSGQSQPEQKGNSQKALSDILLALKPTAAFQAGPQPLKVPAPKAVQQRAENPVMDDTLIQKFFTGGLRALKEEGEKEWWKSEVQMALYLDKYYGQSYNMNPRPSQIGYENFKGVNWYSKPSDIFKNYVKTLQRVSNAPLNSIFPSISNDKYGARQWGPGQTEISSRIIQPAIRDMDPSRRFSVPGVSFFGVGRSTDWARIRDSKIKEWKRAFYGVKPKNRPYKGRNGGKGKKKDAVMSAVDDLDADRICEQQEMQVQQMKANLNKWFEKNPEGLAVLTLKPEEVDMFLDTPEAVAGRAARCRDVVMRPQVNFVADMQRRTILNLLTLGAVSVPYGWCLFGYISFFFPPAEGGGGAGVTATDALGNVVTFEGWLKENNAETRKLVQGIRGDATYLIVTKDKKIEDYALNAVCTHLGCVVPWNRAQNKFMCPCHGSQYDTTGKVVRGPAPLSLALAHVTDSGNGKVTLTPWTEQDFRTGQDPWWKP